MHNSLVPLIVLGGICHLGILVASALVPKTLHWNQTLASLTPLNRRLIWTHAGYLVGTIVCLGLLSVAAPQLLTDGSPLARITCGFVAAFWGVRLLLQFFVFDPRDYLTTWWLAAGYHSLTLVFLYNTVIYAWVAARG